jgi:hypothetical protein
MSVLWQRSELLPTGTNQGLSDLLYWVGVVGIFAIPVVAYGDLRRLRRHFFFERRRQEYLAEHLPADMV